MKQKIALILAACLLLGCATGCDTSTAANAAINVISREDGSGTRGAFIELFAIQEKDADGNTVDQTIGTAEITNNTAVMMTSVSGDPMAIGYLSLGSLNDTVKALTIDGVAPSVESILDGSYGISRPFNIATLGDQTPATQDFICFIMSTEGQDIVEAKGYIRVDDTGAFTSDGSQGTVVVAGSSSVTPVMEALKEAYQKFSTGVQIEIQESDSTTGMNSVIEGICDIGMASRAIKDSELEKGIEGLTIAMDGIAVIVHKENALNGLTAGQVRDVYTGAITSWSQLN